MTTHILKTTKNLDKFVHLCSDYSFNTSTSITTQNKNLSRSQSQIGSTSYIRSLRRAFAHAKLLAFFNPDLNHFITLTYKKNITNTRSVITDIKRLIEQEKRQTKKHSLHNLSTYPQSKITDKNLISHLKNKKNISSRRNCGYVDKSSIKYIYVLEKQKRGAIHVHMIANNSFSLVINKYGYKQLKLWKHGFSNVQTIESFDKNFKPFLYLFKYMNKTERVGSSFIHTSRNFDKIINVDYAQYINYLKGENLLYTEDSKFIINDREYKFSKEYFNNQKI